MDKQPELPRIGIVIPNYNQGDYIQSALNSILLQDYPNKVVAIVDDKSTDLSHKVISELNFEEVNKEWSVATYKGLTVFYSQNQENKGPSFSRNKAIQFLWESCHLFTCLDADDYLLPGYLSKVAWKFIENPEHVLSVYTDNFNLDTTTGLLNREYRESFDYERLMVHNMICSKFTVSKLGLSKIGLYCEELRLAEDLDLSLRLSEQGLIVHIPEALCVLRKTGKNTDVIHDRNKWEAAWQLVGQRLQSRRAGKV